MNTAAWMRAVREANWRAGVISARHLGALGFSEDAIRWRIVRGDLVRLYPGVLSLRTVKSTREQLMTAALLRYGPDAALCGRTAAHLWNLEGFKRVPDVVEIATPAGRFTPGPDSQGVVIRSVRRPFLPTLHRGFRVTELYRTIVDLAPTLTEKVLDDAIDSAQRMWPDTDRLLCEDVSGDCRGIDGAARLRALLEERGGLCTDSCLENDFFRGLRRSSLPRPRHQLRVYDAAGYIVRIDFAWPQHLVALHVDSFLHHSGRTRFEHDRSFLNRLSAQGWHSVFVTQRALDAGDAWLTALGTVLDAREPQRSLAL